MKEKIINMILSFKSDDEIFEFIKDRIIFLEANSIEKTVGVNYTDTFDDYIGEKISYKTGEFFLTDRYPSLKYDDLLPYFNILKKLSEDKSYFNEMDLFSPVYFEIYNYMGAKKSNFDLDEVDSRRVNIYIKASSNKEDSISIKEFSINDSGLCAERSGFAQNMYKILGVDSLLAIGKVNGIGHAYNLLFPRGYGVGPAVLFDSSFNLSFQMNERNYSFGFFSVLSDDDFNKLHNGDEIQIDIQKSINQIADRYGFEIKDFKDSELKYSLGLNNRKLDRISPYTLEK